jgi:peptidoglycan/xylan/chitin deacetylase (PgdA/CDA1 family)
MSAPAIACFTFDNMAEAADVGSGRLTEPLAAGSDPSLVMGFPRVFDLLERCGVRATFFTEGWNGLHHPEAVAQIVRAGHELGMHGWVHEAWAELEPEDEVLLATRATEALERASGTRPRGFRAPGGRRSSATAEILRTLGYRYDASLGDGMQPQRLESDLAQIPFVWPGVDGYYYLRPEAPAAAVVRDTWLKTLDQVAATGGLFLLICHPFISGVDSERLGALEAVMRAAVADSRIEVRTTGEVAERILRD